MAKLDLECCQAMLRIAETFGEDKESEGVNREGNIFDKGDVFHVNNIPKTILSE